MNTRRPRAGVTLLEVVIAVSLLSLLMAGVMTSLRMGLNALSRTNTRLMSNRRVAGAQQALQQQLQGFMPEVAQYAHRIVEVRDGRIRRDVAVPAPRRAADDLAEHDRDASAEEFGARSGAFPLLPAHGFTPAAAHSNMEGAERSAPHSRI